MKKMINNEYAVADILNDCYYKNTDDSNIDWVANIMVEEIMAYFLDNYGKDAIIIGGEFSFLKNSFVHKALFENGIFRFLPDNKLAKQFVDTKCTTTKNTAGLMTFEIESFSLSDLADLMQELIEEKNKIK